jgi:DNA recombination-dependent growth factor C
MGFASRSVSIMRYRVRGEMSGSFWDAIEEGVKKGAFKHIESPGDEVGIGWVSIDDFTDFQFRGASYARGNYIALSLRIDSVRVPPRILEIHIKQETRKLLEESGQQRLSSTQRRELKERVKETLKKQVFPSIQIFDLIWDTTKSVVYYGSLSVKARDRVETHFKKYFGLMLVPVLAYIRAEELLEGRLETQILENLKPSIMAP